MKQQGSISRHAWLKTGRWTLLVGLLLGNLAQAATTYIFGPSNNAAGLPACEEGWGKSDSNKEFTCTGRVMLASGDVLEAERGNSDYHITVIAHGGFDLENNTIGTADGTINLKSTSGTIVAVGSSNTFSASVTSDGGAITLSGSVVKGSVSTGAGVVTLGANVEVIENVSTQAGAVNIGAGNLIGGSVSTAAGDITVGNGSTIGGAITSTGAGIVALGESVKVAGGVSTQAGAIGIGANSVIGGATTSITSTTSTTAGVVTLGANVEMTGDISTQAGAVNIGVGNMIGGSVSTDAGVVTLTTVIAGITTGTTVKGSISTVAGGINVGDQSIIGGAITSTGAGIVKLGATVKVTRDVSTVTGGITIGDGSRVCGNVGSTGAGVVVLTDYIRVGGSVSTAVGAITMGTTSTVNPESTVGKDVISKGAGVITLTRLLVGGKVSGGAGAITVTNSRVGGTVTSSDGVIDTSTSVIGDGNLTIPDACSDAEPGEGGEIDHFEFVTSSGAHTCSPQTVTVSACTNAAPAACAPYSGNTTVELSSNGWIGGSTKTLVNGVGSFSLQGLAVSMPLGIVSSGLGAKSQPLCKIGAGALSTACSLSFAQSGFSYDVPDMLANKESTDIVIKALVNRGTPSSAKCEPAFTNTSRDVSFWSDFIDPAGSNLSDSAQLVSVNGSAVGQTAAAKTVVKLAFDDTGSSLLAVNYREAGKMQLSAIYAGSATEGDSGLMIGADQFVARPAGFCLQPQGVCTEGASCLKFRKVGQTFTAGLTPVAWQSDSDNDLCGVNSTTTNYRQMGLVLAPELVEPNKGVSGVVLLPVSSTYDHLPPGVAAGWNGVIVQNLAFSEVGVFRLSVKSKPGEYFGSTVAASSSDPIGRFYPTHFKTEGRAHLKPSCSVFSYQGQHLKFSTPRILTVTAYGLHPSGVEYVTRNYDFEGFWRLGTSFEQSYASLDGTDQADASNRIQVDANSSPVWTQTDVDMEGDGMRSYQLSGEQVSYARNTVPQANDLPFSANIRFTVPGRTLTDSDDICLPGESCPDFSFDFGGSDIRLGRLSIGNAHGSELQPLSLPVKVESWQDVSKTGEPLLAFGVSPDDNCSTPLLGTVQLESYSGRLEGHTEPSPDSPIWTEPVANQGIIQLTKPGAGNGGSVQLTYELSAFPWLKFDWNGDGELENASGLATFGIYKGELPLIFRRELYR